MYNGLVNNKLSYLPPRGRADLKVRKRQGRFLSQLNVCGTCLWVAEQFRSWYVYALLRHAMRHYELIVNYCVPNMIDKKENCN